jgi:hypothetical protein
MWCTPPRILGSLIVVVVVATSCGDDNAADDARPATFGDDCTLGGLDACKDPFACIELPDFSAQSSSKAICTVACQANENCPSWEEPMRTCQSQCMRLICRDVCR